MYSDLGLLCLLKPNSQIFRVNTVSNSPSVTLTHEANGITHSYQLDQSISVLRFGGWYFFIAFKF